MAKRLPGQRTSKSAPPVTGEHRIESLVRKFRTIAEDHLASGGSRAEWANALGQIEKEGADALPGAPEHFPKFQTFARLLEHWYADSAWLNDGDPRPLKPTGATEFPGLCVAAGIAGDAASLASLGLELRVLRKTTGGRLLPVDRTALVTRPSPMVFDLVSVGMAAWQSTIRHNLRKQTTDHDRRLDRGVFHAAIPAALESAFHRTARAAGKQLVDDLDNWLQAHKTDPEATDARLVGVHVFATTMDEPQTRRGDKRRVRR